MTTKRFENKRTKNGDSFSNPPKGKRASTRGGRSKDRELVLEWEAWLKMAGYEEPTIYNYSRTVRIFLEWLNVTGTGPARAHLLTASRQTILLFLDRERPRQNYGGNPSTAARTKRREVATLRNLYHFLIAEGHTAVDPTTLIGRIKVADEQHRGSSVMKKKALRPQVAAKLIAAAESDDELTIVYLGFYGLLRRSSIVQVTGEMVKRNGTLADVPKKGGGTIDVPLGLVLLALEHRLPAMLPDGGREAVWDHLSRMAHERDELPLILNGDKYPAPPRVAKNLGLSTRTNVTDPAYVYRVFEKLGARIGNAVHPHQMRHTGITTLLDAGVPVDIVRNLAGHTSVATTSQYIDQDVERFAEFLALQGITEKGHASVTKLQRKRRAG